MTIIHRVHNLIAAMPYGLEKMLSLMDIEESTDVKTACVPIGGRPRIVFNPEYVANHCETDEKLFMLIQHELHHVLLGHTRLFKRTTMQHNIAFDAIINAMLCRSKPEPEWTALFRDSYSASKFPECLLRPPKNFPEIPIFPEGMPKNIQQVIQTLYYSNKGTFFDVFALLVKIIPVGLMPGDAEGEGDSIDQGSGSRFDDEMGAEIVEELLGSHGDDARGIEEQDDPDLFDIVREIVGEWPQPPNPIAGRSLNDILKTMPVSKVNVSSRLVRQIVDTVLASVVCKGDEQGGFSDFEYQHFQQFMPSRDRRAFAMQQVGGMVPMYVSSIPKEIQKRNEVAVYLDVSGSMEDYPQYLVKALYLLQKQVTVKTFVFSTKVVEVDVSDLNRLSYETTGGTSGACVWKHIEENKFTSVVLLTDGYVGMIHEQYLSLRKQAHIEVLLPPNGSKNDIVPIARRCRTLFSLT